MKFTERSKAKPYVIYDGEGRVIYFNDRETEECYTEYLFDNQIDDLKELVESLKKEENDFIS